jgi:membrane-bound lytic murein transglycosylase F
MAPTIARLLYLLVGVALLATGCGRLGTPEQAGELVVGVLDDPVHYQPQGPEGEATGFEYDLIRAFAAELKVPFKIVVAHSPDELTELVNSGRVHFAAAAPVQADTAFHYTSAIRVARLVIAQHEDALPIDEPDDLIEQPIAVLAGGPAVPALHSLATSAPLKIDNVAQGNDIDLLAQVASRKIPVIATDSAHFDVAANFYPELVETLEFQRMVAYAWAFREGDDDLWAKADAFIAGYRDSGQIARLHDRYFGHIKRINSQGAAKFIDDMRVLLPHYRQDFERAAAVSNIDWRLLAALSYQESHWNPVATSPTGVRGIMMLTEDTADRMQVSNRLDPRQSIMAGARYLSDLMDQLPVEIRQPDRLWLTLAAYNLGMGHLNGARQFALGMKRDATSWYDMKAVLPLMARPEYYARLKSGRARGGEAVILVENVRTYFDILVRFEPKGRSPLDTDLTYGVNLSLPPM